MGLVRQIEAWQRKAAEATDPTRNAPQMPDYTGDESSPRVRGWQERQRQLKQAARAIDAESLKPGEHVATTAGLRYDATTRTVTVHMAGWIVGTLDDEDSARVGRWLRGQVAERGRTWTGRVGARLYHYAHGRWGVILEL